MSLMLVYWLVYDTASYHTVAVCCPADVRAQYIGALSAPSADLMWVVWQALELLVLDDGERRSYYGKTRQEARTLLANALRDQELGITPLDERQTMETLLLS